MSWNMGAVYQLTPSTAVLSHILLWPSLMKRTKSGRSLSQVLRCDSHMSMFPMTVRMRIAVQLFVQPIEKSPAPLLPPAEPQ